MVRSPCSAHPPESQSEGSDSKSYWFNQCLTGRCDMDSYKTLRFDQKSSIIATCELLISMAAAVCNSVCEKVWQKFKLSLSLHRSRQMLLSALFDSKRVYVIHLSLTLLGVC